MKETVEGGEKVSLGDARVVISGGRGLKSGEAFEMLDKLAKVNSFPINSKKFYLKKFPEF